MIFEYEAVNSAGEVIIGELEGSEKLEIVRKLSSRDLKVIQVSQVKKNPWRISEKKLLRKIFCYLCMKW